jgi:multidrug efflux pump subunit AcrB
VSGAPAAGPGALGGLNVSAWSIRNPIPSLLFFMLLTLAGLLAFKAMKIQNFPDVDLPMVSVQAALPGASPGQLENDVARKIENAIATVQGVKHIYTTLGDGLAIISVEFRLEKPVQEAVDDVRAAVSRVRADLPGELRDPIVTKTDLASQPILAYTAASARMDEEALSWFIDDTLTKRLLAVKGVGAISRVGGLTREVRVELDPARLLALNASAADISRQLRLTQQDAAGGRADIGGIEQSVRTLAAVGSAQQLAAMEIALSDGRRVRLDQVARVLDTTAERRQAAFLDGKPVVAFEVSRSRGAGELEVAAGVRAALVELQAAHPDITTTESFDFVAPAKEGFESSMMLLWEVRGAGGAGGVAVPARLARHAGGRRGRAAAGGHPHLRGDVPPGLHAQRGDADLAIAGGGHPRRRRHRRDREHHAPPARRQATVRRGDGGGRRDRPRRHRHHVHADRRVPAHRVHDGHRRTLLRAVRLDSSDRRVLLAGRGAHAHPDDGGVSAQAGGRCTRTPRWMQVYEGWATWCLRHRLATLAATAVFFVGSFMLVPLLPTGFIPPDDLSQTQVTLTLPPGARLSDTVTLAERARQVVARHPQVRLVYTAVGGGTAGADPFAPQAGGDPRRAALTISLSPRSERPGISKQAIEGDLRLALSELPGARIKVGFAGSNEKFILAISGDDGAVLAEHARRVEQELRSLPGVGAVVSSSSLQRPELIVRPDHARMAPIWASRQPRSLTFCGWPRPATTTMGLAKINLAQRQLPVVVRLPASAREDLDLLARLPVPGARGPVMLGNVASLSIEAGPAQIERYDRRRNVNFEIELNGVPLGTVEARADELPSLRNLPPGRTQGCGGRRGGHGRPLQRLRAVAMAAGVLCIYAVLVLLFKDFIQPVTILCGAGVVHPGRVPRAVRHPHGTVDALAHRHDHADGRGDQELHPAGGLRRPRTARARARPLARPARCLPQASAPDRHDHHRDGRGHVAHCTGLRRRSELPRTHGHRGHRRPHHQHLPQPAGDPGGVHLRRRLPAGDAPPRAPPMGFNPHAF